MLIILGICSATSFVATMDHPEQMIVTPCKNAVVTEQTQLVAGQAVAINQQLDTEQMITTPRKNAVVTEKTSSAVDTEIEKRVKDYEEEGQKIKQQFPKLFAIATMEELYPQRGDLTVQLQLAMVRNNLPMVKLCLALTEKDPSFTSYTRSLLIKGIQQTEKAKEYCRTVAIKSSDEKKKVVRYLEQLIDFISVAEENGKNELGFLTGPCAVRLPLTFLCGSPQDIEEQDKIKSSFKGLLVVGLCQVLLPAHREKAKSFTDAQESQKYLDDLSNINSAVWAAYEKKPNELETLVALKPDIIKWLHIVNIVDVDSDNPTIETKAQGN